MSGFYVICHMFLRIFFCLHHQWCRQKKSKNAKVQCSKGHEKLAERNQTHSKLIVLRLVNPPVMPVRNAMSHLTLNIKMTIKTFFWVYSNISKGVSSRIVLGTHKTLRKVKTEHEMLLFNNKTWENLTKIVRFPKIITELCLCVSCRSQPVKMQEHASY